MSTETWVAAPGHPNYEVSDQGRVRSMFHGRSRVLAQTPSRGYLNVKLSHGRKGSAKTVFVHRLVMEAFVGPRPDGLLVRHLNGNQTDNRRTNLAYGTPLQNNLDTLGHGTHRTARVTECLRGHPYDEANTYTRPNGRRFCRTCALAQQRARAGRAAA